MKKIRVFELAKARKITTKELIKLLEKKGLKKVRAITYVDPGIIGVSKPIAATSKPAKPGVKVAHISTAPSHQGALAEAVKLEPVRESSPEKVLAARMKKEEAAQKKPQAKKKNDSKNEKGGWKWPEASTVVAGFAIILVLALAAKVGMLNQQVIAEKAQIASLGAGLDSAKLSVEKLGVKISTNTAGVDSLKEAVSGLSSKVAGVESSILTSQLKSQAVVIKGLSSDIGGPLKAQTIAFAERLSAF